MTNMPKEKLRKVAGALVKLKSGINKYNYELVQKGYHTLTDEEIKLLDGFDYKLASQWSKVITARHDFSRSLDQLSDYIEKMLM